MNEADFNKELVDSLKHFGAYAHKLHDTPVSQARGMRFTPSKPCDIIGGYGGKFFGIESKQIKKFEAFGMRALRPNQIDSLNEMEKTGNAAFVALNIRVKADPVHGRVNRLVIFPWDEFREQVTFKKDEVIQLPYSEGHKGHFDVWDFLNGL